MNMETSLGEESLKKIGSQDLYRILIHEDEKIQWRHGGTPIFDHVNKLFEEGRTKEWPKGSLEETVQNAIKPWEMELSYKTRLQDFKTINPEKFRLIVNGREPLPGEETLQIGSYNALLKSSIPDEFKYYKSEEETFESSHDVFRSAFPRGFAWEVISVLWAANYCLQAQALGLLRGTFQRPCSYRRDGRVLWPRRAQG
ncbi:hypothetical protein Drorol1_Dr00027281 [Drosera rotundifolia]